MTEQQPPTSPDEIQNEAPLDQAPDCPPTPGLELPPYWRFTLVMAEVIFTCELGLQTRRIQFVSKSDGNTFPRTRLIQLQQLAASNVITELRQQSDGAIKQVEVEAVYLLGTVDCGWMTEEEFLHSETTLISTAEMPPRDTDSAPESVNNVVPMHPPL